ncbi:MAG: thiamine phosphate synthase [Sphingomonas sp. 28-62-20]|uniref:thiamine phosphate synthase n=1 Tax=Sphingomonas sp. 28-62-20 TaxID=1970433 RepID=UPI000BDAB68C|nr:MAG: thiamine phosphate synthase [Sphingomonas sp. 28-62-20]
MRARHPLPRLWLMTDERMGESLRDAIERLPRGSGIVFRHYGLPAATRRALFQQVMQTARRRRLIVVRGGADRLGRGDSGQHGRIARRDRGLKTWPAHNARELIAGQRAGADLIFVAPVFATRSHPGARPLGTLRALALARQARVPAIALGGMNARRGRMLIGLGFYGWAAIDAWAAPKG